MHENEYTPALHPLLSQPTALFTPYVDYAEYHVSTFDSDSIRHTNKPGKKHMKSHGPRQQQQC